MKSIVVCRKNLKKDDSQPPFWRGDSRGAPDGHVYTSNSHGKLQYYIRDDFGNKTYLARDSEIVASLLQKNYDEKFYVNFFKDICIDNEEFNVFFNKKMEEEFGEEYKKISTYKKDESGIIKEGVYSKLHISYKFYVQEYEISQHGALSIVNEMTYAIKRALTSYSEIKEEDYDMFNTSSSLFFLTEDISLKNSIDKYFKLSVDMFQSKLISNSKFNDIVESIRKNETELEKILDFIFLDNSLINNESVKKIKKNKI